MNILIQSIAITDKMFNFCKLLTKNAITFDLTEIENKNFVGMKFAHPILHSKMKVEWKEKKINFVPKIVLTKLPTFQTNKIYFRILEALPVILTAYLPI